MSGEVLRRVQVMQRRYLTLPDKTARHLVLFYQNLLNILLIESHYAGKGLSFRGSKKEIEERVTPLSDGLISCVQKAALSPTESDALIDLIVGAHNYMVDLSVAAYSSCKLENTFLEKMAALIEELKVLNFCQGWQLFCEKLTRFDCLDYVRQPIVFKVLEDWFDKLCEAGADIEPTVFDQLVNCWHETRRDSMSVRKILLEALYLTKKESQRVKFYSLLTLWVGKNPSCDVLFQFSANVMMIAISRAISYTEFFSLLVAMSKAHGPLGGLAQNYLFPVLLALKSQYPTDVRFAVTWVRLLKCNCPLPGMSTTVRDAWESLQALLVSLRQGVVFGTPCLSRERPEKRPPPLALNAPGKNPLKGKRARALSLDATRVGASLFSCVLPAVASSDVGVASHARLFP